MKKVYVQGDFYYFLTILQLLLLTFWQERGDVAFCMGKGKIESGQTSMRVNENKK